MNESTPQENMAQSATVIDKKQKEAMKIVVAISLSQEKILTRKVPVMLAENQGTRSTNVKSRQLSNKNAVDERHRNLGQLNVKR